MPASVGKFGSSLHEVKQWMMDHADIAARYVRSGWQKFQEALKSGQEFDPEWGQDIDPELLASFTRGPRVMLPINACEGGTQMLGNTSDRTSTDFPQ
jgi:hypothetical protein